MFSRYLCKNYLQYLQFLHTIYPANERKHCRKMRYTEGSKNFSTLCCIIPIKILYAMKSEKLLPHCTRVVNGDFERELLALLFADSVRIY